MHPPARKYIRPHGETPASRELTDRSRERRQREKEGGTRERQGLKLAGERKGKMVGLFSRISGKVAHRPQQSLDEKEAESLVGDVPHSGNGVDLSEEFAPVEHPLEPRDIDKPARCPVPEPSIVHDGRIWKERVAVQRRRLDMVTDKDALTTSRRRSLSSEHLILPSRSAPANVIFNLLD